MSGIGLGIAHALLAAEMNVIVTYRRDHHLAEARRALSAYGNRVHAMHVDVSDRDCMRQAADDAVKVFGKVHVVCNNAGVGIRGGICEATHNDWDWAISVNIMGVVNGIKYFLPRLCEHGEGGHFVTTASMSGLVVPPVAGLYAATKFAAVGIMEALRGEVAGRGIGASVYCPGLVHTNLIETEDARPARYAEPGRVSDPKAREFFRDRILANGMDPLEAGRCVLEGIRHNRLYILSHPEFEAALRERFEAILQAVPAGAHVPQSRIAAEAATLANPVYAAGIGTPTLETMKLPPSDSLAHSRSGARNGSNWS